MVKKALAVSVVGRVTELDGVGNRKGYTGLDMDESGEDREPTAPLPALYFFPDQEVTESELREVLGGDSVARRAWAVSHLLRYAQWEDIWDYVSRDDVREIFAELDLPENLRQAWARMLKIEASVT